MSELTKKPTRKVLFMYRGPKEGIGTADVAESQDNPFEITWTQCLESVTFYLDGVEVGTVYREGEAE